MKYILFNSIGILEKDLIGTAVVHSLKQAYPHDSIVVVSNNPEVWLHNPNVYRVYKAGNTPYFYDDYVHEKDSVILWQDPYNTDDFLQKRNHIIEIWCDLCKIPYRKTRPQLFFTQREQEVTKKMLGLDKPTHPLFIIQTHHENFPQIPYIWNRDIPTKIAHAVVESMHKKGFQILHLRSGKEPVLPFAQSLNLDIRQIFCAINFSDARLFINSCTQHVAGALGKKSVVFWVSGDPLLSGYPLNTNIVPDSKSKLGQYIGNWNEIFATDDERLHTPFPIEDYYSADQIINNL